MGKAAPVPDRDTAGQHVLDSASVEVSENVAIPKAGEGVVTIFEGDVAVI